MTAWEQIQQTVDYLEDHLGEEVDPKALADMAALSPFYFQRLFRRLVKRPLGDYVKQRRLARAADALPGWDGRILDLALELGFSSHEHFTRSFKEAFGMTPEEYRNYPCTLNRQTKPEFLLQVAIVDEGVPLVTEGIVLELERRMLSGPISFAGLKTKMPVDFIEGLGSESGVDPLGALWDGFHRKKAAVFGLPETSGEIGVTLPCGEEGYFLYFAGAQEPENEAGTDRGDGCVRWELTPGEYLVCSFEAESFEALVTDALYKAQQYVFGVWLPGHGLATEPFCAERYSTNGPGTTEMEIWLKLLPKENS